MLEKSMRAHHFVITKGFFCFLMVRFSLQSSSDVTSCYLFLLWVWSYCWYALQPPIKWAEMYFSSCYYYFFVPVISCHSLKLSSSFEAMEFDGFIICFCPQYLVALGYQSALFLIWWVSYVNELKYIFFSSCIILQQHGKNEANSQNVDFLVSVMVKKTLGSPLNWERWIISWHHVTRVWGSWVARFMRKCYFFPDVFLLAFCCRSDILFVIVTVPVMNAYFNQLQSRSISFWKALKSCIITALLCVGLLSELCYNYT